MSLFTLVTISGMFSSKIQGVSLKYPTVSQIILNVAPTVSNNSKENFYLLMNIVQNFWIISSLWHDDGSRYSLCSSVLLTRVILLLWYIVGLGYCSVWVSWLIGLYYNVIIAHVLFYLGASMTKELPWSHCDHAWSSPYCRVPNENYTIPGKCTTQRYSVVLL